MIKFGMFLTTKMPNALNLNRPQAVVNPVGWLVVYAPFRLG